MIAYGPPAQIGRAYLTRAFNDLDVYVEDVTCQNMWVRLVNRILDGKASISRVVPLGGRSEVLARCAADEGTDTRRRIYIIDADFDLLLGIPAPAISRVYRLCVYCSENLLLSETAALEIAMESAINTPSEQLRRDLAWSRRRDAAIEMLLPLFLVYAVAIKLGVRIDTAGYPVQRLCATSTDADTLSASLIRRRARAVMRAIFRQHSRATYRSERLQISANLRRLRRPAHELMSGKTYLLPLLHCLLRSVARFNDSQNSLKVRLAQHCELTIDPGLARAIRVAAGI